MGVGGSAIGESLWSCFLHCFIERLFILFGFSLVIRRTKESLLKPLLSASSFPFRWDQPWSR